MALLVHVYVQHALLFCVGEPEQGGAALGGGVYRRATQQQTHVQYTKTTRFRTYKKPQFMKLK